MATSRNCSEYDRDSADSDTDSVISTTRTQYGYNSLRNATQRFITHPDITTRELDSLLREPSKLPVEMRARKIPLEHLLQRDNIANDVFIYLIRILTSLCNTGGDDAWNVIRFFAGEGFISIHVLLYIIQLRVQSVHDKNAVHTSYKIMKQIVTLLKSFVQVNSSTEEAAKSVALVMKDIVGASAENDTKSHELLQDVMTINEPTQVAGATDLTKSDAAAPTKSFRDVGILPSPGEVVDSKPPNFSEFRTDGSSRLETYLCTHFQLLRQEIVEPLRASIAVYHQMKRSMSVEDIVRSRECCILYDAQIKRTITSHASKGVSFRVQFHYDLPDSWENTNILAFGNLVCLTTNDFHDMIFGVVAKRDPKGLLSGSVDLRALRAEDASKLVPNQPFLMLDSRIYVEEYYEVLTALKQIKEDGSNMAFVDHIVPLSSAINCPNFLQQIPNMMHDIGPLFKKEATTQALKRQTVKVANANDWPLPTQCNVDDYQMRAIFAALNREVTVITGSPGTGKTYMCLKIAHLKLINKLRDQGPILFISSTRATLDEFLLGVLEFQSTGIVRSGGKTFTTELTQYGIEAYREPYKEKLLENDRAHEAELRECSKRIHRISMSVTFFDKAILSVDVLADVMAREHLIGFNKHSKGAMLEWLLRGKITPRELEGILGQIPTVQSPGGNDRRQNDDRWLESKLLLDYHPDATKASPELREMVRQINASPKMQEANMHNVTDISQLPLEGRWRLYRFWVSELYIKAHSKFEKVYQDMDAIVKRSQRIHDEIDLSILQSASVIGMTTSAAVKVHRVLKRLKVSIVLVDESADILQPITAVVLPPGSKQLVLMGECLPKLNQHQTVKKLTEDSSVKASLFQRLNEHDYSVHTLRMQHRMSPEVSKLARNLSLTDDFKHSPLVTGCSENYGLAHNVFFIEHTKELSRAKHESSFLVELCNYLLYKGCREDQITVLTTFRAQFGLFTGKLHKQPQSVQNFRGGNDIVLFMANGSERNSRPGCIESDMGLITVLTCSRKALFVIGNFNFLGSKSELWSRVIAEARRLDLVDKGLRVHCPQHPGKPKVVTEFLSHQRNGCGLPCESRLDCGHTCKLPCHEHNPGDRVTCEAECGRTICTNGHRTWCKRRCHQKCETVCRELIEKQLPCGHLQKIACNLPPNGAVCRDRCEQLLPCGHPCANECSMPCTTRCVEKTTKTDWDCGHRVDVRCCDGPESCPQPCTFILSCGHACSGTCGKCRRGGLHAVCSQPCGRTLVCGHVCESSCSNECPPCGKKCENRCQHNICTRKCGEPCIPCREDCLWRCRHVRCPKQCGEPCDRKTCDRSCEIILPCGHPCIGLCGEKCPTKCRICNEDEVTEIFFGTEDEESARFVQLEDCGHLIVVESLDEWMSQDNVETTVQLYCCPRCKTPIRKKARYGSLINRALSDIERVKLRIFGNQTEIDARVNELKQKMQVLESQIRKGNAVASNSDLKLLSLSVSKSSHLSKVVARVNRSSFLILLNKLYAEISQPEDGPFHQLLRPRQKRLIDLLVELKVFVCGGDVDRFTKQQMSDLQNEIDRANLHLEACIALNRNIPWTEVSMTSSEHSDCVVKKFFRIIDEAIAFTDDEKVRVGPFMRCIRRTCGKAVLRISDNERVEIVNAVGLSKGHWYKCSRGHIYAIGECGGAMETSSCPECGISIGGQSHRLVEGNEVASEMDGARHAAWPTHAHDFADPGPEFDYLAFDAADIEQQRALEIQIGLLRN